MLRWHMTFERKLIEQSVLPALTFPHHRQHSNPPDRIESPPPCPDNSRFFQHNRREAVDIAASSVRLNLSAIAAVRRTGAKHVLRRSLTDPRARSSFWCCSQH